MTPHGASSNTTLIVETSEKGHRFNYLRIVAETFLNVTDRLVVAIPRHTLNSAEYQEHLSNLSSSITLEATLPDLRNKPFYGAFHKPPIFEALARKYQARHIVIPHADGLAQAMGLQAGSARPPWPEQTFSQGLVMRGSFAYRSHNPLKAALHHASHACVQRSPFSKLYHLDPIAFSHISPPSRSSRWELMPDPVEAPAVNDKRLARELLGIPATGRYLVATGSIDARKGVDLLLNAFTSAKLNEDDRLLLVGLHSEDILKRLAGQQSKLVEQRRIISVNRYVDSNALSLALSAADLVCAGYPAHVGSASIVIRAAAAERPVLGSTFGWINAIVKTFCLGETVDVRDRQSYTDKLGQILDRSTSYRQNQEARLFKEFHTIENFKRVWLHAYHRHFSQQHPPHQEPCKLFSVNSDRPLMGLLRKKNHE